MNARWYDAPGGLTDVNLLIGPYPFRYVPHPDPEILVRVLEREGIVEGWVGHLPSAFWRDVGPGNAQLYTALAPHAPVLRPVPTIHPGWPGWERALDAAVAAGAPAVRAYPPQWGMGAHDARLRALARACGERGLVVLLTVRFEDLRQRHPMDTAGDLTAAQIRTVVREDARVHVCVTAAGKELIEETHWSLTADEQQRCWWDLSWVWGPPDEHLAKLARTIGLARFVLGTQWPMRLVQTPHATLELLPDDVRAVRPVSGRELEAAARRAAGR